MPGNAGFLLAGESLHWKFASTSDELRLTSRIVAYMAEGWEGSTGDAPGFPKNGEWVVKHEGLRKAL